MRTIRWTGIATGRPERAAAAVGTRRVCQRCKKDMDITPEQADKDRFLQTVWYCSFECLHD